ncbi:MAG: sulfotransferase [Gemmataceae bacterium]
MPATSATPAQPTRPALALNMPFLAFAPLDVWYRLLFRPRAHIPARYLPRVIAGVIVSLVVTVLTLPERLLVGLWLRLRQKKQPGPVVILGYYRSGTTHLQFLMSRDPNLYSPRWTQTLSPQGFLVSWSLLNYFLLPFFPDKRPQDNAAFGTDIPAEDDFALANGDLVSSLIGRHVLPEHRDFYDRFHNLQQLTPEEYARWAACQRSFVRKIGLLAGQARVLLKTPSHTARVEDLMKLFADSDGVRFIHISRKPDSVFRSNVGLHRVLNGMYHLQEPLPEEEIERRIVDEYRATEDAYLEARSKVPAGHRAELRLEDLLADPVGQMKRLYQELGLPYTEEFEQRLLEYLDATKNYEQNAHREKDSEATRRLLEPVEPFRTTFGHDRPAVAKQEVPLPRSLQPTERRHRLLTAAGKAVLAAGLSLVPWMGLTALVGLRLDGLVWLAGIAIGMTAITTARRGTTALGLWCALVTLLTGLTGSLLTTCLIAPTMPGDLTALLQETWRTIEIIPVPFWMLLGTVGAYRLGTRSWI